MNGTQRTIVGAIALATLGGGLGGAAINQAAHPAPKPRVETIVTASQVDIACDTFSDRLRVDCVDGYSGRVYASWGTLDYVPCQEDEVVAVKLDPDPTHRLTWECVNAEAYVRDVNEGAR